MPFFKQKQSPDVNERFLGTWRLVKSDGSIDVGNGVTVTFTCDGKLTYVIHQNAADQIMNLVFSVEGNRLLTNQSARPQLESTTFAFDDEDHFILDYGGGKSWFARA